MKISTRTNEDVRATMREATAMATVPNRIAGISSRRVSQPHAAPSTELPAYIASSTHSQSSPRGVLREGRVRFRRDVHREEREGPDTLTAAPRR